MSNSMIRKLSSIASRDPFYCGWYFVQYAEMTGMDISEVAQELGFMADTIDSASLCRSPRSEPPHFREDVEAVANRFHIDAGKLANIVRHVQTSSDKTILLAARDSDASDDEDTARGK